MKKLSDEQLMQRYQQGDDQAGSELYSRYAPVLRGVFLKRSAAGDAEDLVQKTFLRLHRGRERYAYPSPLRPWLLTIAYNLLRDRARTSKRRPETLMDPQDPKTSPVFNRAVQPKSPYAHDDLYQAIGSLPKSQRQVVEMHWFSDMPYPEIAQKLATTPLAVRLRAHRAYQKLRQFLQQAEQELLAPALSEAPST